MLPPSPGVEPSGPPENRQTDEMARSISSTLVTPTSPSSRREAKFALQSDTKVQWTTRTGASILLHAVTSRRGTDSSRAVAIRVCKCPRALIKSGLPWRGAPCPLSDCWSARSPDLFTNAAPTHCHGDVGRGRTAPRRCVSQSGCRCDPGRWAHRSGAVTVLGAAVFSASNAFLARFGAAHRKRCGECIQQPAESQQPGSGVAIALGDALDAVPEAIVLGVALRDPVVPLALVVAFSLGNLPVALSSTAGMLAAGRRYGYIVLLWSAIAIGAALAIMAGYVGFGSLSQAWPPRLQAFGAGALLAMAAETMIPEAFHNSPRFSGLLAAFGFGLLLLVDATTR